MFISLTLVIVLIKKDIRRIKKVFLLSDFESTDNADDVCRQGIALREMRHRTSSNEYRATTHEHRLKSHAIERHRTTSNDDAAVIERDEDEIVTESSQCQIFVASPHVMSLPVSTQSAVSALPVVCQNTVATFSVPCQSTVTSLPVDDRVSVHSSPEMKCQRNKLTNEYYTCI